MQQKEQSVEAKQRQPYRQMTGSAPRAVPAGKRCQEGGEARLPVATETREDGRPPDLEMEALGVCPAGKTGGRWLFGRHSLGKTKGQPRERPFYGSGSVGSSTRTVGGKSTCVPQWPGHFFF